MRQIKQMTKITQIIHIPIINKIIYDLSIDVNKKNIIEDRNINLIDATNNDITKNKEYLESLTDLELSIVYSWIGKDYFSMYRSPYKEIYIWEELSYYL
jgi:hypothetical protein